MDERKTIRIRYLCAFLLPFVIACLVCIKNGVYPFGENCILHIDMYHQYEPFFTELMDKLKHGKSLLYSFRLGLGSDFVSLFAYYLASPLNWFLLICPNAHVIEFMTLLVLIKIGLCGLSFAIYLQNHFSKADASLIVFAAFYALSGYMAAYSWNIMWLDCLVLAPLVILGLESLVKEGTYRLYCLGLVAAILSNFYIAIMLCIFLVIWFALLLFEEVHGMKNRMICCGRFALYSLLGGGMGAVLLLPEAVILSYSGSSGISVPRNMEWYFDLISMLGRHCMNVAEYTGRDHWPNLYCGAGIFLFLTLYFCSRKLPKKVKIRRGILLIFFWISFANNILDFIWHGLHFPDSLPGRQAFLYIFVLLVMAYEAYQNLQGNTWAHIIAGIVITIAFLAAVRILGNGPVDAEELLITGVLAAGYGLLLLLLKIGGKNIRANAKTILLTLAALELWVNFSVTGFTGTSRTSYTKNWDSVKSLLAEVNQTEEAAFYRTEEMERLTKNDAAIYGYASSTTFSSLMNIGVSRFYRNLGMEGGKNFYSYSGSTPLTSAMLSVKYLISKSPYEESPLRGLVAEDGSNYIYENLYTLPLGFLIDTDLEENWIPQSGAPIANLNSLAKALGAKEDMLFENGTVEISEKKTTVTVSQDCYLYGTYTDTSVTNIIVTNGSRNRKFNKCDHGYILDLGWCKAGEPIEITNTSNVSNFAVKTYALNLESFQTAYNKLNAQTLELTQFDDTKISGQIETPYGGNLVISIPKEAGWRIYIDETETECGLFGDSLMSIPLTSGTHQITLRYMTPGLKAGAAISLASLLIFLLICAYHKSRNRI